MSVPFSRLAVSIAFVSVIVGSSCNFTDGLEGPVGAPSDAANNAVSDASGNDDGSDAGNNRVPDATVDNDVNVDLGTDTAPDTGPTCGNGILDPGEICDGDCPTCDDGDPCTDDVTAGSAETCNVVCSTTPVTACVDGDACCPAGCASDTDMDCPCIPTTCIDAGRVCNTLPDGCGQTLDCGTCANEESCLGGACQASLGVGDSCPQGQGCPQTGACITEANAGWPGGYCSLACPAGDTDCPAGTHCEANFGACVLSCTEDSECSPGYGCFDFTGTASDPRQDGRTECLPLGSGAGAIGAACVSTSDCGAGPGATCIQWQDGYCSYKCDVDADCPPASHCSGNAIAAGGDCFETCTSDADCRGGNYGCFDLSGDGRLECAELPICPPGWMGPRCDQPDCTVPAIPAGNEAPYCTAGFCKDSTGACLRLVDNPTLSRANTNSACIPAVCCEPPMVTGTCNAGFCNDGTSCQFLANNPQYARDPATTACIQAECGLDCDEPGGGCNPGFCFDGNAGCLWLTTYTELQRGAAAQCLPLACP